MLPPVVPLQSGSARQSLAFSQILTHSVAAPMTPSHSEPSGHSVVSPGIVHACVQ